MKKFLPIFTCFFFCIFGFEHCASKDLKVSGVHMKGGTQMAKDDFVGPWVCITNVFGTKNQQFSVDSQGAFSLRQGDAYIQFEYLRIAASKRGAIFKISTHVDQQISVTYRIFGIVESVAYMSSQVDSEADVDRGARLDEIFAKHGDIFPENN